MLLRSLCGLKNSVNQPLGVCTAIRCGVGVGGGDRRGVRRVRQNTGPKMGKLF